MAITTIVAAAVAMVLDYQTFLVETVIVEIPAAVNGLSSYLSSLTAVDVTTNHLMISGKRHGSASRFTKEK